MNWRRSGDILSPKIAVVVVVVVEMPFVALVASFLPNMPFEFGLELEFEWGDFDFEFEFGSK